MFTSKFIFHTKIKVPLHEPVMWLIFLSSIKFIWNVYNIRSLPIKYYIRSFYQIPACSKMKMIRNVLVIHIYFDCKWRPLFWKFTRNNLFSGFYFQPTFLKDNIICIYQKKSTQLNSLRTWVLTLKVLKTSQKTCRKHFKPHVWKLWRSYFAFIFCFIFYKKNGKCPIFSHYCYFKQWNTQAVK